MINKLTEVINQLSELSDAEQEKIATMITNILENQKVNNNNNDPLKDLKNSDFIGCFSDDSDLAEKSEQIAKKIISNKIN